MKEYANKWLDSKTINSVIPQLKPGTLVQISWLGEIMFTGIFLGSSEYGEVFDTHYYPIDNREEFYAVGDDGIVRYVNFLEQDDPEVKVKFLMK